MYSQYVRFESYLNVRHKEIMIDGECYRYSYLLRKLNPERYYKMFENFVTNEEIDCSIEDRVKLIDYIITR